MDHTLERLQELQDRVKAAIEDVEKLIEMENPLPATQFVELLTEFEGIFSCKCSAKEGEVGLPYFNLEEVAAEMDLQGLEEEEEEPTSHAKDSVTIDSSAPLVPDFPIKYDYCSLSEPTCIPELAQYLPTVYGWFLRRTFIQFNLVYRGSRDGFTSKAFH
jgi:hypothetical protein